MVIKPVSLLLPVLLLLFNTLFAQPPSADSLKKALDTYPHDDTTKVIRLLQYAASLFRESPEQSTQVLDKAFALANRLKWSRGLAELYTYRGNTKALKEHYDAAIADHLAALKIAEDNHVSQAYFNIHFDLSGTYLQMKEYELAATHARHCIAIATAEKNDTATLYAIGSLADIYSLTSQPDSATLYLDRGMTLATRLNDHYMLDRLLSLKADILWDRDKDYTGALKMYRQNLAYQSSTGNKAGLAWMHCVLSRAFTDLGHKDSAYYHAALALDISKKNNLAKELKDAYKALQLSHARFGDYKKAYGYLQAFDSLHYKSFNPQSGKNAEKARMELTQQRKDALAEAEKVKREAATQRIRNLLLGLALVGLITAVFQYRISRQKQKAKAKIELAYTQLKATQQQLIQSEKMASLGELTAGIAHEIQNPLNFVNNFSEVSNELINELKGERVKTENERDKGLEDELLNDISLNLEKIAHHGKRADAIVKGMLQHSRSSTGQKEPTDINALCDEYLRLTYHGIRAKDKSFNVTLNPRFDNSIGRLNVVPQDMGRVIMNLLTNAFYAVNEKAKTAGEDYKPAVSITTKKTGDTVEIQIQDNGNGIPQNVIDKIFQPFFTTKPTGEGTGLGLSLSYDIITKVHGGELKVTTAEGEGSTFIIQLNTNG